MLRERQLQCTVAWRCFQKVGLPYKDSGDKPAVAYYKLHEVISFQKLSNTLAQT